MAKELAVAEQLAALDPKVTVFVVGAICIVALGGMALGYDIDFDVLGVEVKLGNSRKGSASC